MDEFNKYNDQQEQDNNSVNHDIERAQANDPVEHNHEPTPRNYQKPNNSNEPRKVGVWKVWLSGIIGGLTVAILGFLLLYTGIIPGDYFTQTEPAVEDEGSSTPMIQTSTQDERIPTELLSDVAGSVVGVSNIQSFDLWSDSVDAGTGSGVIYKVEGERAYVVTNQHVIDGANQIEVILSNGDHVDAVLLGEDELTDLAVLSIGAEHVDTVAEIGDSEALVVGESAIAIGNPLGTEFAGTVTKGIISGLNRTIEIDSNNDGIPDWTIEVIQTDAAINPGNSGGALINSAGELIGINSMKIASHAIEGIGFAIPINEALPIIEQLEGQGTVSRPFIGISAIDFSHVPPQHIHETLNLDPAEVSSGIVIADVHARSAAEEAGLQVYDVVVSIDGTEIEKMLDLRQYLYRDGTVGETVTLTYYRDGELQETEITLQAE